MEKIRVHVHRLTKCIWLYTIGLSICFVSRYDINRRLFEAEEQDLFADLQSLPRNAALRYRKLIHVLWKNVYFLQEIEWSDQEGKTSKGNDYNNKICCLWNMKPVILRFLIDKLLRITTHFVDQISLFYLLFLPRFMHTSSPVWGKTCRPCLGRKERRRNWLRILILCK